MGPVSQLYRHLKLHSPETAVELRAVLEKFLLKQSDSNGQSSRNPGTHIDQSKRREATEHDDTDLLAMFLSASAQEAGPLLRRVFLLACLPPSLLLPATVPPRSSVDPLAEQSKQVKHLDSQLGQLVSNAETIRHLSASVLETAVSASLPMNTQMCIRWNFLRKSSSISAALRRLGNTFLGAENPRLAIAAYTASLRFLSPMSDATQPHAGQLPASCRDSAVVLSNRSAAHLRLGNAQAALRDGTAAIRFDSSYPKAWFRRASACAALVKGLKFRIAQLPAALDQCSRRSEARVRSPERALSEEIRQQARLLEEAVAQLKKEAAYASSVCAALREREETKRNSETLPDESQGAAVELTASLDRPLLQSSVATGLQGDDNSTFGACRCMHARPSEILEEYRPSHRSSHRERYSRHGQAQSGSLSEEASLSECRQEKLTSLGKQNTHIDGDTCSLQLEQTPATSPYLKYLHPQLSVNGDEATDGRGVMLSLSSEHCSKRTVNKKRVQTGTSDACFSNISPPEPQVLLREYPVASYCSPSENSPLPPLLALGRSEDLGQLWEDFISDSLSSCGWKAVCAGCFTLADTCWQVDDGDCLYDNDDVMPNRLCSAVTLTTPCAFCTSVLFCCIECRDLSHHVVACRRSFGASNIQETAGQLESNTRATNGETASLKDHATNSHRAALSRNNVPAASPDCVFAQVESASTAIFDCIEQAVLSIIESACSPYRDPRRSEAVGMRAAKDCPAAACRASSCQKKELHSSTEMCAEVAESAAERSQVLIQEAGVAREKVVSTILQATALKGDCSSVKTENEKAGGKREFLVPARAQNCSSANISHILLAGAISSADAVKGNRREVEASAHPSTYEARCSEGQASFMNLHVSRTAGGCLEDSTRHVARQIMGFYMSFMPRKDCEIHAFASPRGCEKTTTRPCVSSRGEAAEALTYLVPPVRCSASEKASLASCSWAASRMHSLAWHLPRDPETLCDFVVNAVWIAGEYFFSHSSSFGGMRGPAEARGVGEAQTQAGLAFSDDIQKGQDRSMDCFTGDTGTLLLRAALRAYGAVWSNSFGLSLVLDESDSDWSLGRGLYLYASQFNHSCLPNALAVFGTRGREPKEKQVSHIKGDWGGTEVSTQRHSDPFVTGCPIEVRLCKEENTTNRDNCGKNRSKIEITLSYGPLAGRGRNGWKERQTLLRTEALFQCLCKVCTTWPAVVEFGGSDNALGCGSHFLPLHPDFFGGLPCPRCTSNPATWEKVTKVAALSVDWATGFPKSDGRTAKSLKYLNLGGRIPQKDALLDAVRALMLDREDRRMQKRMWAVQGSPQQGHASHRQSAFSLADVERGFHGVAALKGGPFLLRTLVTAMKRATNVATGNKESREAVANAIYSRENIPGSPERVHALATDSFTRCTDSATLALLGHSCVAVPSCDSRHGGPVWRCVCCKHVWTGGREVSRSFEEPRSAILRRIFAARSAVQKALRFFARKPRSSPPERNERVRKREQTVRGELSVATVQHLLDELLLDAVRTTGQLSHEVCEVLDLRAMLESGCAHSPFSCDGNSWEESGWTKAPCAASANKEASKCEPDFANDLTNGGGSHAAAFEALLGAVWVLSLRYELGWAQPEVCVELYKCACLAGNAGAMAEATLLTLAAETSATRCYGVHHRISQMVRNLREALPTPDNGVLS
ncbi:tetratricopeptide repeat-containing protein [Toxoplasma gondii ARI]|uniref:Tetratricopeptide repeat-containing protein n=1 Tax=Toxoplasma gondii ARI TaxID=1074872 RepID=A0A139Y3U4_TOXGO|nr:tetratricopeptide repeat-containing protein [Toxoplasma gondii ARI]